MLFVAGVHGLRISEPTGRGIQIESGVYLTNDCAAQLDKLLARPFRMAMGGSECHALLNGAAAVYSKDVPNEPDPGRAVEMLTAWLQCLDAFFMALWVLRDNAVNCELGFLEHEVPGQGVTYASNFIASRFSTARGMWNTTAFSLEEVRQAREYFGRFFLPQTFGQGDNGNVLKSPTEAVLQAPVVSAKGVPRLSRLIYFLSGARGSRDLGVKISLYMTCLEIMFSIEESELSHRLSERVAFFLYTDPAERLAAYRRLKRAYGVRSKVIHGSVISAGTQRELPEVAGDIDEVLRRLVLKVMSDEAARKVFDLGDKELEEYFARLTVGAIQPP